MARYTRSLSVALPLSSCLTQLKAVLESNNFEVLLSKQDCMIARETPGGVPFAKLATLEILVDSTKATDSVTRLDVLVKNEELPLQTNNHCHQIFTQLNQAINQHSEWRVLAEDGAPEAQELPAAPSPLSSAHRQPPSNTAHSVAAQSLTDPLAPIALPKAIPTAAVHISPDETVVQVPHLSKLQVNSDSPERLNPQEPITQPQLENAFNLEPTAEISIQTTTSLQEFRNSASLERPQPQDPITKDALNLESRTEQQAPSTTSQSTPSLEALRTKRAESVANLERLRQKRAESIANLEKMRQKRERMLIINELEGAEEEIIPLDLPEHPSTSQA